MKLYAISDLHLGYELNRQALATLPPYPEDWLIVAGDIGETEEHLKYALTILTRTFAQVLWLPGNHDLWTVRTDGGVFAGEAKYRRLVAICHDYGVITPEDPYILWPSMECPYVLAPLFTLYDYSFRPDTIAEHDVVTWAEAAGTISNDEFLLDPSPYASKAKWCQVRCQYTEQRLAEVDTHPLVLINHFPLRQDLVRLPGIPRFSPWCGTRRTEQWHTRFSARVVVYGHLHMRATDYRDGVRFEEVSLGYPRHWHYNRPIQSYLREILPATDVRTLDNGGPFWHW